MTEEELLKIFKEKDACWMHNGDPKKPHAQLTSGKCSNGFFDCMRVLKDPELCRLLAEELTEKLKREGILHVDWVIGSPYAAITFSYEVASNLGALHAFPEKSREDKNKMVWKRFSIPEGATILQVEELITTAKTFREVRRAVTEENEDPVDFLPIVATIIHRPPKLPAEHDGTEIISLLEKEVWAVEQKDCPLCKKGSKRYRPKTHWAELTK